jgi:hypothetical protein
MEVNSLPSSKHLMQFGASCPKHICFIPKLMRYSWWNMFQYLLFTSTIWNLAILSFEGVLTSVLMIKKGKKKNRPCWSFLHASTCLKFKLLRNVTLMFYLRVSSTQWELQSQHQASLFTSQLWPLDIPKRISCPSLGVISRRNQDTVGKLRRGPSG